jgi:hypothetical protein
MVTTLSFDPESHTYALDGYAVPGVTKVLKPLQRWFGDVEAMERGSKVHERTAELDWGLNPRIEEQYAPYVAAWERCKDALNLEIVAVEKRVGHPLHRYAGTLDRVVRMPGGTLAVVDLKTSYSLDAWVGCQLAGYREAWNHRRREKATESMGVSLRDDGTYRVERFTDHAGDFAMFLALLTEMRWKEKHFNG